MKYHFLRAVVMDPTTRKASRTADGRVVWELECGQKVAMPPQKFPAGFCVQVPDGLPQVMECPGCYNGAEETRSDKAIRQQQAMEAENSTLDEGIGEAQESETIASAHEDETLKVDDDPYGETLIP